MKDKQIFLGKTAVITGGSGILCSAMAEELGSLGANIVILSRTIEKGKEVTKKIIESGGKAEAFACDVTKQKSILQVKKQIIDLFGGIDILINGAGGGHPKGNTTHETFKEEDMKNSKVTTFFNLPPDGFDHTFKLNLMGTWLPSQIFAEEMINRKGATIINISSMAATRPATKVPAYGAAKAGIDNLTQWMAVHLSEAGIRVNSIAPGFFLTTQNKDLLINKDGSYTTRAQKIISHTPQRRFGKPEDLLGAVVWLCDESKSGFVTGAVIPVDGGFLSYSGV